MSPPRLALVLVMLDGIDGRRVEVGVLDVINPMPSSLGHGSFKISFYFVFKEFIKVIQLVIQPTNHGFFIYKRKPEQSQHTLGG